MLLVDDLAAGGTKNLRHTPRGLVTLNYIEQIVSVYDQEIPQSKTADKLVAS